MEVLTASQFQVWLKTHDLVADPYPEAPEGYACQRLLIPEGGPAKDRLVRAILDHLDPLGAVVQVADWSGWDQEGCPESLRWAGASASTFDRVAMRFGEGERVELHGCLTHVVANGMSAYLFVPRPSFIAYAWEGHFLDLWSRTPPVIRSLSKALAPLGAIPPV